MAIHFLICAPSLSLFLLSVLSLIVKSQQYAVRVTDQWARCAENFKNTSQPSQSENRVRERERECARGTENEGGYIDTNRRWFLFSVCERDHEWGQDGVHEQMKTVIGWVRVCVYICLSAFFIFVHLIMQVYVSAGPPVSVRVSVSTCMHVARRCISSWVNTFQVGFNDCVAY